MKYFKLILIPVFTLIILSFIFINSQAKNQKDNKVFMVILAHPDDEAAVGQVLAKYGKHNKVYLVIATDGRYGVTKHAGIPAGDTLVQVRKAESQLACLKLGIEPPVFLGFHDGMGIVTGIGEFFDQAKALKEKLKIKMEEINPDVIITFGPDGDTDHFDHRNIGNITTEIILREGWYEKYPLYFIAWEKTKAKSLPQDPNYLDEKYLSIKIKFSDDDEAKLFDCIKCYKSQLTEKEMEEWIKAEASDKSNIFYFRQFKTATKQKDDF